MGSGSFVADYLPSEIGGNASPFVIHGRSKERSDAAQTRGSMPRLLSDATVQNQGPVSATFILSRYALGDRRGMDPRVSATPLRDCSTLG